MEASLLVELVTEELPPRSLRALSEAFADQLVAEIVKHGLKDRVPRKQTFATPRRIAVLIPEVRDKAPDSRHSVEGPAASNAKAVEGFARKHKLSPESLERRKTAKGEIVVANFTLPGVQLDAVLANIVEQALKGLPAPKLMRWGSGEAQFVRPVHGLLMLHGARVVPGRVLGLESGNRTRGHRFLGKAQMVLAHADEYEARLADEGRVIADFAARRADIAAQLHTEAKRHGGVLGEHEALLDEVTALVEHPSVYAGRFDAAFLEVPHECLTLTMRQNQKYFPLFDAGGKLLPTFLIVSNMRVADPRHIVRGNERVVRPRLEDARFFYRQDRKARLEERVPQLGKVVYHHRLGSQLERVERVQLLAGRIARGLGGDAVLAERAAWLAKADLVSGMVGEFPELQGIMGAYYAAHDGEDPAVAAAIRDQYRLRYDEAAAANPVSAALYLADRLDALAAMFAVGNAPTGDKDPFGLRRAALGVISVYEALAAAATPGEQPVPDLWELLDAATGALPPGVAGAGVAEAVADFVLERYRHSLASVFARDSIDAVLGQRPPLVEVLARVRAVEEFRRLPQAASLAAANKRIRNLLLKSPPPSEHALSERLFAAEAERALYAAFRRVDAQAQADLARGRFAEALAALAVLKEPVDAFFEGVMVNAEDAALRNNRLTLLQQLDAALNRVADLSRLAQ